MQYDPQQVEEGILKFWSDGGIFQKARDKVKGNKPYYFLDGPPYTSGKMHIGLAWNKSLKDALLRYKRMRGFDVWDRAGYDMHGLPTELKVQDKLGLKHKDEIPGFGVQKFMDECRTWCTDNMKIMNKDFTRLGVWMDFENAYMSISKEFMEGEWWLVKKAHENKRLYKGKKVMHWCQECATSLAKHELEYKNVKDDSIFLKFKVKGKDNAYLIVWTTTPWTIPFNLGIMAGPEIDYIKAKVDNEVWIMAKALAGIFIQGVANKQFETREELKGQQLEGLEYEHPLADLFDYASIKQEAPKTHTVVLSEEYVDTGSGTGLVHMAPGCGPEDYEVGRRNGIPAFNILDENGVFPEGFKGFTAKKDDNKIRDELERRHSLIATTEVEHEYPHCWRCKKPVIFRTTEQWFFKVEDLTEEMRKLNKEIKWVPDWAGHKWFDDWLENLRDNGITRQRYWGCPAPIWQCTQCENFEVIGSADELKQKAGSVPEDLHIPHIDNITFRCGCGGEMKRIPDVLDVWIDAGTTSWTCLDYPHDKKNFEKLYPPDHISEGKDQIRGWFNLLFVASMVSMNRPSYKSVYMHGFVNDAQGRKMSKSVGNIISPYEVIDKQGADTLRFYTIGGAQPGLDLNYNFDDIRVKHRTLSVLWNLHNYLLEGETGKVKMGIEEKWMLSKLNSTIKHATLAMDDNRINEVPLMLEQLLLELSRTYIQFTREKEDRETVMSIVAEVLLPTITMLAPFVPFISERIYQDIKDKFSLKEESVHFRQWPGFDEKKLNPELEHQVDSMKHVIQSILSAREKAGLGLRWPLKDAVVETEDEKATQALIDLKDIVRRQCNIKDLDVIKHYGKAKKTFKVDYDKLGPDFGKDSAKIIAKLMTESVEAVKKHIDEKGKHVIKIDGDEFNIVKEHIIVQETLPSGIVSVPFKNGNIYLVTSLTPELEAEGFARELMRRVQALRKKEDMQKPDRIKLHIQAPEKLLKLLEKWNKPMADKVGADELKITAEPGSYPVHTQEKVRGKEFGIWMEK
ncbi:MAG: isoleucine--tRNA ligase [Nanoarchaeota archaeon]|nr:isoleucine--tRNA ligase [Nanoarchaeota archaeon]